MNPETFTYTISSNDRDNDPAGHVNEYFINFGGFGHHTGKYTCEVVSLVTNGYFLENLKYVNFIVDGLHSGGYYSNRPSYECILCAVDVVHAQTLIKQTTFIIDNCRIKKRVRFSFYSPSYVQLVTPAEININNDDVKWSLVLKLTPILNN